MSGRLFLLLFFVLQMAGTAVALWLLAALDGCWWPFGPRYTVVKLDGKADRKAERTDSAGGADGAQDVVRGARQDGLEGSDRHDSHVQRSSAEAGRAGDGEAMSVHREGVSPEGSGIQGAGAADAAGFRAELERRAAAAGFRR